MTVLAGSWLAWATYGVTVSAVAASLLITLPALRLPSVPVVRRSFPSGMLAPVTVLVVGIGVATSAVVAVAGTRIA